MRPESTRKRLAALKAKYEEAQENVDKIVAQEAAKDKSANIRWLVKFEYRDD